MRKITLLKMFSLIYFFLFTTNTFGQTTVNFDTDANWTQDGSVTSLASYGANSYSESGATFQGTNVLRNTTSPQDGFAGALGTYSMRLKNSSDSKVLITLPTGGLTNFSLAIRRWDSSPMPDYTVKYSLDGGVNWTSLTNIDGNILTTSDFFTYTSSTINSVSSTIQIEIANTGTTERIMIDNFTWTGYTVSGFNELKELNLFASNGKIIFNTDKSQRVVVFNSVGQQIVNTLSAEGRNEISVPNAKGMYIVKVGTQKAKVIL